MKLKIGKVTYDAVVLTGDFPIKFYKETGIDVFKMSDSFEKNPLEAYDGMLNLAYYLSGESKSFEEFCSQFTTFDVVNAYANINECFAVTTKPESESMTEKKQQ